MTKLIKEIEEKLRMNLNPLELDLWDESHEHKGHAGAKDGASHFFLRVVSTKFTSLNRIQRHKLVYGILDGYIPKKIHALSVQAISPEELKL
jgi:BolA protein